ncbi:cholesterol 7-desaturase nvd-like [Dermacentor andersoni]|uniref:cholesterol 7-desaturase nvd-like n=1 Tax=Dermacentor andersoni TaxID=34620 RepID=UPI003B3B0854
MYIEDMTHLFRRANPNMAEDKKLRHLMRGVKQELFAGLVRQDFVVFRTADGVAHVLDAYCPHLGAYLAGMGRVVGDCVECPFHGWRFQGETGACTYVPYASKGEEPEWSIDDYAELSSRAFRQMSRYETKSEAHVRDIAENVAGTADLNHIHEASWLLSVEECALEAATTGSWKRPFKSVTWQASWSPGRFSACAPFCFEMSLFG